MELGKRSRLVTRTTVVKEMGRDPPRGFAATSSRRTAAGVELDATTSMTWRGRRAGAGTVDLLKKDCKVEKDRGPLKLDGKPEVRSATKSKSADGPVVEENLKAGGKGRGRWDLV